MLPAESSVTPGISLLPRTRGPIPERKRKLPTRFACGNAPTGSGARLLSNDSLIFLSSGQRHHLRVPVFHDLVVHFVFDGLTLARMELDCAFQRAFDHFLERNCTVEVAHRSPRKTQRDLASLLAHSAEGMVKGLFRFANRIWKEGRGKMLWVLRRQGQ